MTKPRGGPRDDGRVRLARVGRYLCGLAVAIGASAAATILATQDGAAQDLVRLVKVGPWPAVSALVGFGDRLWFVNSVKYIDHNSADVYSYDPQTGVARYERHLFSQDAGDPVVANGLLYWPFEDARFSMSRGEFMVTNGRDWQWRVLAAAQVFHVHAMRAVDDALYAATGGIRGGLQISRDRGVTWSVIYQHDNPPNSFSRLISLGVLGSDLYGGLMATDKSGGKLLQVRAGVPAPVRGWPDGTSTDRLAAFGGWLYAVNERGGGSGVWRADGSRVERVQGLSGGAVRGFASNGTTLWAVGESAEGGLVWESHDGVSWQLVQRLDGVRPVDAAVYAGRLYVGVIGADGQGELWGPAPPAPVEASVPTVALLDDQLPPSGIRLTDLLGGVDRALADFDAFEANGGALQTLLEPIIVQRSAAAGQALSERLGRANGARSVARFAGRPVTASTLADWQLIWAIARTGHGRIPPSALSEPWTAAPSPGAKYAALPPGTAWAVAELHQADDATVEALIERLDRVDDPAWLRGDFVGALTAVTGQRLGYDGGAWRSWWANRRSRGATTK